MCEKAIISSAEHIRDRVCRLCLEECRKLAHLENLYFDDTCFLDILRDCYSLEIDLSQDHLPLWICRKCVTMTLNFYMFKNSIFENEVFLQSVNLDEVNRKMMQNVSENAEVWQTQPKKEYAKPASSIDSCKSIKVENLIQFYDGNNGKNSKLLRKTSGKGGSKSDQSSTNESGYACSECSSSFTSNASSSNVCCTCKSAREPETSKRRTEKRYVCMTCKQLFSSPTDWKEHTIKHYETHKYPCLQCNESFDSKHELVVHNYTHLYKQAGEKQFKQQLMTRVKHKLRDTPARATKQYKNIESY